MTHFEDFGEANLGIVPPRRMTRIHIFRSGDAQKTTFTSQFLDGGGVGSILSLDIAIIFLCFGF